MKNQRRRRRNGQAGVTLIEMLVVVVIIGLFVALVAPNMFRSADKARVTAIRIAVCIGTENPTRSAQPTTSQSHGSTETSRARTSWPLARSAAAGEAT